MNKRIELENVSFSYAITRLGDNKYEVEVTCTPEEIDTYYGTLSRSAELNMTNVDYPSTLIAEHIKMLQSGCIAELLWYSIR